jgi:hypothetical protein
MKFSFLALYQFLNKERTLSTVVSIELFGSPKELEDSGKLLLSHTHSEISKLPQIRLKSCKGYLCATLMTLYHRYRTPKEQDTPFTARDDKLFNLRIHSLVATPAELSTGYFTRVKITDKHPQLLRYLFFFHAMRFQTDFDPDLLRFSEAQKLSDPTYPLNFHLILNLDVANNQEYLRFENSRIGDFLQISVHGGHLANRLFLIDIYKQAKNIETSNWQLTDEISMDYFIKLGKRVKFRTNVDGFKQLVKTIAESTLRQMSVKLEDTLTNVLSILKDLQKLRSADLILSEIPTNTWKFLDFSPIKIPHLTLSYGKFDPQESLKHLKHLKFLHFINLQLSSAPILWKASKKISIEIQNCSLDVENFRLLS